MGGWIYRWSWRDRVGWQDRDKWTQINKSIIYSVNSFFPEKASSPICTSHNYIAILQEKGPSVAYLGLDKFQQYLI